MTNPDVVSRARSLLAVPGHRPDRFAKAVASGADLVMLDLEDSVGVALKDQARDNVDQWLSGGNAATCVVRINDASTPWHRADLSMLAGHHTVVVVPKITQARDVVTVLRQLGAGARVIAILETAAGILRAEEISGTPGVVRTIFGNADLGSELAVDPADGRPFGYARSTVVLAAAANHLPQPLDGATVALEDTDAVAEDSRRAAALGFGGKACLHPRQVAVVNDIFTPSPEVLAWARDVLASTEDGSVVRLNGEIVGKPILDRARRILAMQPPGTTLAPTP